VDLQISVLDFDPLAAYRDPLAGLGYVFRADNEDRRKRYFREPPGTERTHVHVRLAGSETEQSALLFRDFLRAHPAVADEYGTLKRRLASQHRDDRRRYTEAKDPFIRRVLAAAEAWREQVDWLPASSDS
jgi:GrpB-like predicted nucleotidyltransferase (UPF0157 family)